MGSPRRRPQPRMKRNSCAEARRISLYRLQSMSAMVLTKPLQRTRSAVAPWGGITKCRGTLRAVVGRALDTELLEPAPQGVGVETQESGRALRPVDRVRRRRYDIFALSWSVQLQQ